MTFRWICLTVLLCAACQKSGNSPPPASPSSSSTASSKVVAITVTEKGFEPDHVDAAASQPLTLRFTRKVEQTCADAVEVQGDPVRHMLPLDKPVDVKVKVPASGEIAFACPMDMYRGAIKVVAN